MTQYGRQKCCFFIKFSYENENNYINRASLFLCALNCSIWLTSLRSTSNEVSWYQLKMATPKQNLQHTLLFT